MADIDGKDTVEIDTSRILSIVNKLQTAYNKSVAAKDNFKGYQDAIWNNLDSLSSLGVEELFSNFDNNLTQPPKAIWDSYRAFNLNQGKKVGTSPNGGLPTVEITESSPASKINSGNNPSLNTGSATNPTTAAASSTAHSTNNTGGGTARTTAGASPVGTMNTASSATQAATKQAAATDPSESQGPQNQGAWLRSQLGDLSNKLQQQTDVLGDIRVILENMSTSTVRPTGEGTGVGRAPAGEGADEKSGGGGLMSGAIGVMEKFIPFLLLTVGAGLVGLLKGNDTAGMTAGIGSATMDNARNLRADIHGAAMTTSTAQKARAFDAVQAARENAPTDVEYQASLENLGNRFTPETLAGAQNAQMEARPYSNLNMGDRARIGFFNNLSRKIFPQNNPIPQVNVNAGLGQFPTNAMGGVFNSNTEYANELYDKAFKAHEQGDREAYEQHREAARNALRNANNSGLGDRVDAISKMSTFGGRIGKSLQIGGIAAGAISVGTDLAGGVGELAEGHGDRAYSHFGHAAANATEFGAGMALFRGQDLGAALRGGAGLAKIAGRTGVLSAIAGGATLASDAYDRHLIDTNPNLDYQQRKDALEANQRGMVDDASGAVGGAVGGVIGGALGSLIPIPVVGTAIGAIAGGFVGDKIGRWAGEHFQGPTEKERNSLAVDHARNSLQQVGNLTASASTITINGQNINTNSSEAREAATRSLINNATKEQAQQQPSQTHVTINNHFLQPPTAAEMVRISRQQIADAENHRNTITQNQTDHSTTGR